MKYLMLCCFDEKRWEAIPDAQRGEIMRRYGEWIRSLDESGHHLASAQLQPVSMAVTVRGGNGKPAATDGPYAETKEQLGGYHLVECKDLDEALALAKRIPTLPFGGAVEVRPLLEPA
ncbi:MAG: YciI family protein [Burkholderiales bacterium]|nr:YciI family protein [Burkholderiales bacterium]